MADLPPAKSAEAPTTPRPRRRRLRWVLLAGVVAFVAFAAYEVATWPDVGALATKPPASTAFIERYKERRRHDEKPDTVAWRWVPYSRISGNLKRAVLVSEDIGFFSHHGFETAEMEMALRQAWERRRLPRGASTISQQVAKNLWLSPSRNPWRKVKEALLTRQLERRLSKRRILELYLNVAELGPGVYGAEAAARHYFGKPASALTEREAAQLAASLPRPSKWHPGSESQAYRRQVSTILARMAQAQWLWKVI